MKRELFFLLLFLVSVLAPAVVFPKEYKTALFKSGTTLKMEVAQTEPDRQRGLMFREQLPAGTGMLFIFPVEAPYRFWMKNCKFPIDIIWLNAEKVIVYAAQSVPPCKSDPCPDYGPHQDQSALYVIETSSGFIKKQGLHVGMAVGF